MIERFLTLSTRHPWRVISATACCALAAASLCLGLRIAIDVLAMLPKNLPVAQQFATAARPVVPPARGFRRLFQRRRRADNSTAGKCRRAGGAAAEQTEAERWRRFLFERIDGVQDRNARQERLEGPFRRFVYAEKMDNAGAVQPRLVEHRLKRGPCRPSASLAGDATPLAWSRSTLAFGRKVSKELRMVASRSQADGQPTSCSPGRIAAANAPTAPVSIEPWNNNSSARESALARA